MSQAIKKAVIPAAGLGTRFLPATKTVPKEMLTVVDKPILLYVVEEAVEAGIEDIVIVQGRGKGAIEDFFDTSYELEVTLEKAGKLNWLQSIQNIKNLANIISIRQKFPLGLGHAVETAKPIVGQEPFALLLGDEIMIPKSGQRGVTAQLCELYEKYHTSCVAVMEVSKEDVKKYGILSGKEIEQGLMAVETLVEKPDPEQAPSQWAMPGRYVFDSALFACLSQTSPSLHGEIQLTDAMVLLAQTKGLLASHIKAQRFDAGDKIGFLQANLELALLRPELRSDLITYLKKLILTL